MELPYIRIRKINELIKEIPIDFIKPENDFRVKELSTLLQISKSSASNFIVSLKALGFIEGKKKFRFTKLGEKYAKLIIRGQESEAREILREHIKNFGYFQIVLQKLKVRGKLTIEEIGNILALHYDKAWKDVATVKNYGASVASVLDFIGFGIYRDGALLAVNEKVKEETEFVAPDVNVKKIFSILKALYPSGSDIHTLSQRLETKEGRLSVELGCCILLGLVKRSAKGYYEVTEYGKELIDPLVVENEKKRKFRLAILKSPSRIILVRLLEKNKTVGLTVKDICELLEYEFRKNWNEKTKQSYAKKFIDWLKFSEILLREKGGYQLKVDLLKEELSKTLNTEATEESLSKSVSKSDLIKYYLLGKSIGQIIGKTQEIDIDEIVGNILMFCREEEFEDLAEDWKSDYQLFKEIGDCRIFLRDIRMLEKVLGVMSK